MIWHVSFYVRVLYFPSVLFYFFFFAERFLFRVSDLPKSLQSGVLMFHFSQHKSPVEARRAEATVQVWDLYTAREIFWLNRGKPSSSQRFIVFIYQIKVHKLRKIKQKKSLIKNLMDNKGYFLFFVILYYFSYSEERRKLITKIIN